MTTCNRVQNPVRPSYGDAANWGQRDRWPASWISAKHVETPGVYAYRLQITSANRETVKLQITADERYELFLDGQRVGRGSERGDVNHWFFETYDVVLEPGDHTLVARVWSQGEMAPFAQMTLRHGFMVCPIDGAFARFATGEAPWEVKRLGGYQFNDPIAAWGTGANITVSGAEFSWGFEQGLGDGWEAPVKFEPAMGPSANDNPPGHLLSVEMLPAMMERAVSMGRVRNISEPPDPNQTHATPILESENLITEVSGWQGLIDGGSLTIPPHSKRRVLVDLEDYFCAYPEITTSGGTGSSVRIHWQEALFENLKDCVKGNRDEIEGKFFFTIWHGTDGIGDTFLPDGGTSRKFETLWWQCGRYVEIVVQTQADPLTLNHLGFRETRYPFENQSEFESTDPRLAQITPIAIRTLQMCSHETYMDCPYYEQLQYIGDTRLQALVTYAMTSDHRLPKKALRMFDISRVPSGLTQSRYPTRVRQLIPPFSLWWVGMVHDFALWNGDLAFVKSLMPGVRAVLDAFDGFRNSDGLVEAPDGWNFVDWVPAWPGGVPADGVSGVSGPINLQTALAFRYAADLEGWMSEPELSAHHARKAGEISHQVYEKFWAESRGMLADDLGHLHFSEHSQVLAILEGSMNADKSHRLAEGLLSAKDLAQTTIYFTHYLFEAYYRLGEGDKILERLGLWFDLPGQGFKTTLEMPEPTRSDCHAWGAHPVYHMFASLLGIRPTSPGFATIEVAPCPGSLARLKGKLPVRDQFIVADWDEAQGQFRIDLPENITGTARVNGTSFKLNSGNNLVPIAHP